ncbi:cysteine dioxygenase family protein [Nonomuraea sp. NPDC050691]|uniref:cysteine dioxygenase family protein n=1 Tax=Nonomuraea sp. NPDC050691 TaxID=3155661 RepID=UPI0033C36C25
MEMSTITARPGLSGLVTGIGRITARGLGLRATAHEVAALLRGNLPGADILTPEERAGAPGGYVSHVLHAQEDFSITAVVWQPDAETVVHDHVSWCAFGVISGNEHETLYRDMGDHLVEIGRADNRPGDVSGFAPPGDIHRVRNTSGEVGVSIHVYGADIGRLGSSIRRAYDLPIR